jgi:Spy/CpxP family protein refolding chaperone
MDLYKKNRLLFWFFIFLVLINISALVTYFIFFRNPGDQMDRPDSQGVAKQEVFRQQLDLTTIQSASVDSINELYRQAAAPVVDSIKAKRSAILDELNNSGPDTMHLNRLVNDLSALQARLQHENIRQYLSLKKICTPDQALRLSGLYRDLYGFDETGKGNRHRQGQNRGQGHGQGRWRKGQ